MIIDIQASEDAEKELQKLSQLGRKRVLEKIGYLVQDPCHPSLNTHRLHLTKIDADIWDCYISDSMRLLYEVKDGTLRLWSLGSHAIVDKAHLRSFAAHTRFSRLEEFAPALPMPSTVEFAKPTPQLPISRSSFPTPLEPNTGSPNCFAFFQNAHLRILGVPADLIQQLKKAPSIEAALALPGLALQTRLWLEELSTSPDLETVLFDPSRLLFRTTLDRLEGYCEGKIKRLMLNLQRPEQQRYVDIDRTPLILLKGAAGSGKTTVGIYRAIRLASEGRRVLVLTYNSTLSSITRSLIEELIGPLPRNLQVRTHHSLMMEFLRKRSSAPNLSEKDDKTISTFLQDAVTEIRMKVASPVLERGLKFYEEEIRYVIKGLGVRNVEEYKEVERYGRKTALGASQREVVWRVYEAYQRRLAQARCNDWSDVALLALQMLQKMPFDTPYEDIIVDEAQDLTPVDLRVIQQLVVPSTGRVTRPSSIMALADAAQTLYSRGFSWKRAGIQARGHTAILRKNYRNTRQIAEVAAHLLEQNTLMRASNEYVDPEGTQRQGPPPFLMKARTLFEQMVLVRERILDLVSDQVFRLSDFAVLCPTRQLCRQCQHELDSAGLRTVLHTDSDFDLLEERIKILTIYSAKGLEFPVVFLLGLTHGVLPSTQGLQNADAEEAQLNIEQERMRCYVGMTRAAEALYLLTVKGLESRFVKELTDKVKLWQ